MASQIFIDTNRIISERDQKIYGHFLEHFHRQIYDGIYAPGNAASDAKGFRRDVMDALKNISVPIIRWPGGCFVSAYHWKNAIGSKRVPMFDKAWRVEEPNTFGTDEFMDYCRELGAEPYICTNAGTGSPEEMSDWVEYCNLENWGKWAKARIENGHAKPYNVKYWSIGNENYGTWEMGAKSSGEWGRFVKESAKMMKRVDPSIQILAASVSNLDWNINLLKEAGDILDWISIHGYWDPLWHANNVSPYEQCMVYSTAVEEDIIKMKHILGCLGYLGKIKIAYDEWNLRAWHHPKIHQDIVTDHMECIKPRDLNDINSTYTMADAVFTAIFLNKCLKNSDVVGMANFAPTVNTRGLIYTYKDGIVLRSTYFVYELFTKYMKDIVIDSYSISGEEFDVMTEKGNVRVPALDVVATKSADNKSVGVSIVNRHPDRRLELNLNLPGDLSYSSAKIYQISSLSKDSYNDVDRPDEIKIHEIDVKFSAGRLNVEIPEHSVNVLVLT